MTKTFIKTFAFNSVAADADFIVNQYINEYYNNNKINLSISSIDRYVEFFGDVRDESDDYMVRIVVVFEYEYDRITTSYYLNAKDGSIADQLNKIMKDYNNKKLNARIINASYHRPCASILDEDPSESLFVIIEHDEEENINGIC